MKNSLKVGIIGGSSFLGQHLVDLLIRKNFKVVQTYCKKKISSKKNLISKKLDLTTQITPKKLSKLFGSVKTIIYISTVYPVVKIDHKILKVNFVSVVDIVNWCKKNEIKFVYISSSSIYSSKNKKQLEKDFIGGDMQGGLYSLLKLMSENYILSLKKNKFNYLILRPSSIYGRNQTNKSLILDISKKIKNKKNIFFYKPLNIKLNLIDVRDVARSIVHLIELHKIGIFNIGSTQSISLNKLINIIKKNFNKIKILKKKKIMKGSIYINPNTDKLRKTGFKNKYIIDDYFKELTRN